MYILQLPLLQRKCPETVEEAGQIGKETVTIPDGE